MRGLGRRHPTLKVALDILDDHDRVVDDDADREHKAEHDRLFSEIAEAVEHGEGADQRDRYQQSSGMIAAAPALQKQVTPRRRRPAKWRRRSS